MACKTNSSLLAAFAGMSRSWWTAVDAGLVGMQPVDRGVVGLSVGLLIPGHPVTTLNPQVMHMHMQ
jgi:hypothetical protein